MKINMKVIANYKGQTVEFEAIDMIPAKIKEDKDFLIKYATYTVKDLAEKLNEKPETTQSVTEPQIYVNENPAPKTATAKQINFLLARGWGIDDIYSLTYDQVVEEIGKYLKK